MCRKDRGGIDTKLVTMIYIDKRSSMSVNQFLTVEILQWWLLGKTTLLSSSGNKRADPDR